MRVLNKRNFINAVHDVYTKGDIYNFYGKLTVMDRVVICMMRAYSYYGTLYDNVSFEDSDEFYGNIINCPSGLSNETEKDKNIKKLVEALFDSLFLKCEKLHENPIIINFDYLHYCERVYEEKRFIVADILFKCIKMDACGLEFEIDNQYLNMKLALDSIVEPYKIINSQE